MSKRKGKAEILIWPISRLEYEFLISRVSVLASENGKYFAGKFIPGKVKKK